MWNAFVAFCGYTNPCGLGYHHGHGNERVLPAVENMSGFVFVQQLGTVMVSSAHVTTDGG